MVLRGLSSKGWLPLLLVVVLLAATSSAAKTECYVNASGDLLDPNNIYKCAQGQKCCREEGLPSCCATKEASVAVWEQVRLWGILITMIIILALVMWFCRHDGDCCCNAKDGRKSCCGKAYGKKPEDKYVTTDADGNEVEVTGEDREKGLTAAELKKNEAEESKKAADALSHPDKAVDGLHDPKKAVDHLPDAPKRPSSNLKKPDLPTAPDVASPKPDFAQLELDDIP